MQSISNGSADSPTTIPAPTPTFDKRLELIETEIMTQLANGRTHFKSRVLSDDIPVETTRGIGQAMKQLQKDSENIDLEKWGGSSSCAIWHVQWAQ